jgi:hypothetical protein
MMGNKTRALKKKKTKASKKASKKDRLRAALQKKKGK